MSSSLTGFRVQRINDLEELQRLPTFGYDGDDDDGFLIDSVFQQLGMGRPLSDADSTVVDSVAIGGTTTIGDSSSRCSSNHNNSSSHGHDNTGGAGDVDLVANVFQQLRMGQPPPSSISDDVVIAADDSSMTSLAAGSRVIIVPNSVNGDRIPSTIDEEDMLVANIFDQLGMGTPPSDDEASLGSFTSDHIDHEEDNGGRRRRPSSSNGRRRRRRRRFPGMVRNLTRRFRSG